MNERLYEKKQNFIRRTFLFFVFAVLLLIAASGWTRLDGMKDPYPGKSAAAGYRSQAVDFQFAYLPIVSAEVPTELPTAVPTEAPTPTITPSPTVEITTAPPNTCDGGCTVHLPGCDIKGNISFQTGEKIYHVPGGQFYDVTIINPEKGERWFCTETEAVQAGWRRSLR